MINLLTQFPELEKYDLTSLERMAYGDSPMAPELIRRTRAVLPHVLKDMIVTGGENVYSGEVEAVLYEHPAVREAAVFGIPDPKWGEPVMACVVLKPGEVLSANDLMAYCQRSLANYKIPRRVEFLDTELPKSGSGKMLKRILRERYGPIKNGP
jgi:acyl-coenzyme A synthetase/AMP-(fatty) acid ligase